MDNPLTFAWGHCPLHWSWSPGVRCCCRRCSFCWDCCPRRLMRRLWDRLLYIHKSK